MGKQRPWDQYEAAILLEATVKVLEGSVERKDAISYVSKALRDRAQKEGFAVDDTFRNEAGITFQMYSMESAYLGHTVLKPATKLFSEIVQLKKEDLTKYRMVLHNAIETQVIIGRDLYQQWLIENGLSKGALTNMPESLGIVRSLYTK